jgi:hypothetical protein
MQAFDESKSGASPSKAQNVQPYGEPVHQRFQLAEKTLRKVMLI